MSKPIRTCVGCGKKANKKELIRFVCNLDKSISIDSDYKKPGRGAYICPEENCIKTGIVPKRIKWVLRADLNIKDVEQLKQKLLDLLKSKGGKYHEEKRE